MLKVVEKNKEIKIMEFNTLVTFVIKGEVNRVGRLKQANVDMMIT